jgi:hypothetical protein
VYDEQIRLERRQAHLQGHVVRDRDQTHPVPITR